MKRKIIGFLLFALIFLNIFGCHKADTDKIDQEEGISLYYLNVDENALVEINKKLDLSEDPIDAAYQIIDELGKKDKRAEENYHPVLNKQVSVDSVKEIEEGELSIDFGAGYLQMTARQEILFRAALVKSLLEIDGIDRILFTVEEKPLTKDNGLAVGIMNEYTFVLDSDRSEVYDARQTVALYYANQKGNGLVKKEEDMEALNNESMESVVINALKYPEDDDVKATVPMEVVINHISVIQKICYVDFNEEIEASFNGIDDEIKMYSIINSLTSLERVSQVQFTVNGKVKSKISNVSGMDQPLGCDYTYVIDSENP